ncbi:MAG: DUF481 domain-containing protein [Opitutaceae bacterium]|nr:DUF481 domain-containing protein [Opitutaceae bacterium]
MTRILVLFALVATGARGGPDTVNLRDTLVYKDGDRIQGTVVSRTAELIVFRSDRFGELRVKPSDAVIIPAEKTPGPVVAKPAATPAQPAAATTAATPAPAKPAAAKPPAQVAKDRAKAVKEEREAERVTIWDRFTPGELTAHVRGFFGPWKGRFAFSTEFVSDVANRKNDSLEARITRKWERDELQFNARYDYAEINDIATADLLKGTGSWRHEFNKSLFAQYRPSVEWNRVSRLRGLPNDYILLQQEIGVGFNILNTPTRKVRLGVSENLLDIWNSAPFTGHTSRTTPSTFQEIEVKLPWQMGLTQRGVWYPVRQKQDGWENRIELNKKLTETLSTSVRHEVRRHHPDGGALDYDRLKLLFALDF